MSLPVVQETELAQRSRRRRKRVGLSLLLILSLAGAYWWIHRSPSVGTTHAEEPGRQGPPTIPVVAVAAVAKDVPIYLDGLGTVQALNSVTIRVRIDGQLTKIAFKEGQDVHEGDFLAQVDPSPFEASLAQANAKEKQDQAQLANARLDLTRNEDLLKRRVISSQQYDTQKTLVAQLEASVAADQAAIESAKVQLGYTRIVAPIDGRVGIRMVDKGNIVHPTDANGLIVIAQIHPINVIFTLPEQNVDEIRRQMAKGELAVFALDREGNPTLGNGKLSVIDNQIDTTTGTIRLKATFPNEDLRLWPGQFVNARMRLSVRKGGIVVPAAVIQRGPDGTYAFVIRGEDPHNSVEVRPVKVALMQQGEALIDEGLKVGERVVLEGQYRLQAKSRVKLMPPSKQSPTPQP